MSAMPDVGPTILDSAQRVIEGIERRDNVSTCQLDRRAFLYRAAQGRLRHLVLGGDRTAETNREDRQAQATMPQQAAIDLCGGAGIIGPNCGVVRFR